MLNISVRIQEEYPRENEEETYRRIQQFYGRHYRAATEGRVQTERVREYLLAEAQAIQTEIATGDRVLEVGCSEGRIIDVVKDRVAYVCGIEYVEDIARKAEAKYRGVPNVQVVCGDFLTYPFADASFDVVVFAFNTLGTMPPSFATRCIANAHRVLVPGGRGLVSVYSEHAKDAQIELYTRAAAEDEAWTVQGADETSVWTTGGLRSWRFSEHRIRSIIEAAPFHVESADALTPTALYLKAVKMR